MTQMKGKIEIGPTQQNGNTVTKSRSYKVTW